MKSIRKVLEENGFTVEKEDGRYFISQYTPLGEDWGFHLDKLKDFPDYAYDFNPDEEFKNLMSYCENYECSARSLFEDQLWKRDILDVCYREINGIKQPKPKVENLIYDLLDYIMGYENNFNPTFFRHFPDSKVLNNTVLLKDSSGKVKGKITLELEN